MGLSNKIISDFVDVIDTPDTENTNPVLNGTVVIENNVIYVRLDGSNVLTPVSKTVSVSNNDRVTVMVQDHSAIITGNATDISASSTKVTTVETTANTAQSTATNAQTTANAAQSTAANAQNGVNTLNSLNLTGRNLYVETRTFSIAPQKWKNLDHWSDPTDDPILPGFKVIGNNAAIGNGAYQEISVKKDEVYTVSAWIYGNPAAEVYIYSGDDASLTNPIKSGKFQSSGLGYEKIYYTFTMLKNGTFKPRIQSDTDDQIYVGKIKVEKGTTATDWTAAPEDIIEGVDIYTVNSTTINGAKITTGSVTADKINVSDLFAQNITATGNIQFDNGRYSIKNTEDQILGQGLEITANKTGTMLQNGGRLSLKGDGNIDITAGRSVNISTGSVSGDTIKFTSPKYSFNFENADWNMTDIVVASGMTGTDNTSHWYYICYANGIIDLVGTYIVTNIPCNTAFGSGTGWYRTDEISLFDYPDIGTVYEFITTPVDVTYNFYPGVSGTGGLIWPSGQGSISTPPSVQIIRPADTPSLSGRIVIKVRGRYK